MRHAAGQPADGVHPLRPEQVLLQSTAVGPIVTDTAHRPNRSILKYRVQGVLVELLVGWVTENVVQRHRLAGPYHPIERRAILAGERGRVHVFQGLSHQPVAFAQANMGQPLVGVPIPPRSIQHEDVVNRGVDEGAKSGLALCQLRLGALLLRDINQDRSLSRTAPSEAVSTVT